MLHSSQKNTTRKSEELGIEVPDDYVAIGADEEEASDDDAATDETAEEETTEEAE